MFSLKLRVKVRYLTVANYYLRFTKEEVKELVIVLDIKAYEYRYRYKLTPKLVLYIVL